MRKQPMVATRTRGAEQKRQKILQALHSFPEGATPSKIARETGLNANTVKGIISKIPNVTKIMRGYYKVERGGDGTLFDSPVFSWNFHNCILSASCAAVAPASFDFSLVRASLSWANGRATFRVSSDYPLNVSALSFVAGFFGFLVDVSFREITVSSVEFNQDFAGLRLDGLKSLALDSLIEQFKVYQKSRGLRFERKVKVPFSMNNIMDLLSQPPLSQDANVKLSEQAVSLARLSQAMADTRSLLFRLVDKLGDKRV